MKIVPPDTIDPTPFLFNSTMYTLSCLLGFALMCNVAIRPVHARHFEQLSAPINIQAKDVTQGVATLADAAKINIPSRNEKNE
jgi:hypothetical protein